jgi:hypothetical protein
LLTARAEAANFDSLPLDGEAEPRCLPHDCIGDRVIVEFGGTAAAGADHELADMLGFWSVAADIGIERFDAVNEALLDEELESAVDGGRRRSPMHFLQRFKDCVGAYGFVAAPHELQNLTTERSQAGTSLLAKRSGAVERSGNASEMVVYRVVEGWGWGRWVHALSTAEHLVGDHIDASSR